MKILVVESGSKGNATLIIDKGRILLIDMGVSLISLKNALKTEGYNLIDINAMLLTHEHSDHTLGIQYLPPVPIYTAKETYNSSNINEITPYEKFYLEHFEITPISTSHDVKNPLGFIIRNDKEKLVYVTDTGKIPSKSLAKMKNGTYYIIESNHDVEMLLNTNRPWFLKQRILSDKGHLSNEQSATYMTHLVGPKTKQIILAHLSLEANKPSVALGTYKKIFKDAKIDTEKIEIKCADQFKVVKGGLDELRRI